MITVSGSSFDISGLAGEYRPNSVEAQLLVSMSQSGESFRYSSLSQLQFELRMRREIVDAAIRLHRSGLDFATFHQSRCNDAYWKRLNNGGFLLKNDADPGRAVSDIFRNGKAYATECATAMMIVYYGALLGVFEEEQFNRRFTDIYLMDWAITDPLLKAAGIPRRTENLLLGDRGYIANPDVDPKTPQWQGENVIVLPDSLYYGHGVGVKTAEQMVRALNANRRAGATRPAYLRDTAGRPDFKLLASLHERQSAHLVWTFPPARVQA
jgi:protein-glutamine gamma-glutamyltransferase